MFFSLFFQTQISRPEAGCLAHCTSPAPAVLSPPAPGPLSIFHLPILPHYPALPRTLFSFFCTQSTPTHPCALSSTVLLREAFPL